MTGNFGTGSQKYTTYKNADDWGPTSLGPSLLYIIILDMSQLLGHPKGGLDPDLPPWGLPSQGVRNGYGSATSQRSLGGPLDLPAGYDEQFAMENHRKTIGKWWFNGDLMGFNGIYHLVMTNSSPWFFDGPNRNRWFTELKNGWIFPWLCNKYNQMVTAYRAYGQAYGQLYLKVLQWNIEVLHLLVDGKHPIVIPLPIVAMGELPYTSNDYQW